MKFLNKALRGTLAVALINGIVGGLSVQLAILAHRRLGWSVLGSSAIIMPVLLIAVLPVTIRIMRASTVDKSDRSQPTDAGTRS